MKRIKKFKKNIFNLDKLSQWAKKVKIKDGFTCKACGYKGYLHSHHILPKGKFYKYAYSVWNGITLCKKCHMSARGVHGKKTPRNSVVKKLRSLMFSGDVEAVKAFSKGESVNNSIYKPYKKIKKVKRPYSLYRKRKK